MTHTRRAAFLLCIGLALLALSGWYAIAASVEDLPETLAIVGEARKAQVRDRFGKPLSYTYANQWNLSDSIPLHAIPPLIQQAFIAAEDKRFYEHRGTDWRARMHALWQNIAARRVVRGASTISEQVVRMLHPRKRSVWARYVEGIESEQLERRFSKAEILEFYLNQVPFAGKRRGIVQASRYFWDRDIDTLSTKEILALAVMVRAPGRLDLRNGTAELERGISILARRLALDGIIATSELESLLAQPLRLSTGALPVSAAHFARYVQRHKASENNTPGYVRTTLNSHIQADAQKILDSRVCDLSASHVANGAALVVDTERAEVLAWVNASGCKGDQGSQIDAVTTARQPGSALKPFLYALALSKGWNAATMVDDKPLVEPVGTGLHTYRNYSRTHYGLLPVRDVLGNSLNIPAIKTIQFTGKPDFLRFLHTAGFESLTKPAEFYGEGLALGNGEVSLFELVQGYNALASRGVWRPLRVMYGDQQNAGSRTSRRLVSSEISSIISDILSDPQARRLEFGRDGALRLPVETAVKTGTSTDFRDAWAIGYSRNFTVGVWMGNLNRVSMFEVSGARGPALVLRSIFSKLEKLRESKDLYRSPTLTRLSICPLSGLLAARDCPQVQELFIAGTAPRDTCVKPHATDLHDPATAPSATTPSATAPSTTAPHWARVALPSPGLRIARDPRIPDTSEAFAFELETSAQPLSVTWILNDIEVARRTGGQLRYLWQLKAGQHVLKAKVRFNAVYPEVETAPVEFFVR